MDNILQIRGLTKRYGDFLLAGIDLDLPAGCIVGLIGENGAGKTTTIKAALGLIHPDAGEIRIFGKPLSDCGPLERGRMGAVLGRCPFPDTMRVGQVRTVLAGLYRDFDGAYFDALAERFALTAPKKLVKELSTGMKMKLAIAAAMAHHPRLLILDEATSGLDPVVRSEILDLFLEFIEDGERSVLLSSHITSDLERCADYITFLHAGRVSLSGEKDDLLERYCILKADEALLRRLPSELCLGVRRGAYSCEALCSDRAAARRILPDAVLDAARLEDIMLFISKGESL